MLAKIFEVIMLICFGFSWPFNLIKSIKTRSTKGKSLLFLILIDIGYVFGICSKLVSFVCRILQYKSPLLKHWRVQVFLEQNEDLLRLNEDWSQKYV